ncbi:pilus assembly protein [Xylella taiwanensis]|uniref:Pilus assembly protein n=2 Tax=Xylella taiwanensis TaxID=1444770 RepID=A0ABS8TTE8_9GAMM|nr:pilus assembly protein [Xylella taiwanensis]MCD8456066.1 pilus assembly protein [Xylella taiwanensis]MCD8460606.1 pilus assembly protein [Xylella taiwanensis]MCD8463332.1 pilus assembly protein [Xylella taiwanensis]MCD8465111.1 pilus assembly protein [Xylella taiwanensis]MCD8467328.1 pilus assembly protein [Xylella taiwanensis]
MILNNVLFLRCVATVCIGTLAGISGAVQAGVEISQSPLYVGSEVPGNLAIVASVEYPTLVSVANLASTYTQGVRYVGYFDSNKCYQYNYSADERQRYFYPVASPRPKADYSCDTSRGAWAGNFLNWAATQTIDPFRSALTGGYRVRDTTNETILEKADMDRPYQVNYPRRTLEGRNLLAASVPAQWGRFRIRIDGLGNTMRFTQATPAFSNWWQEPLEKDGQFYDPSKHALNWNDNGIYEVSVRVKVCDPLVGLEPNCVAYPSGSYKPEGLIQQYSKRIRYSIFGYKNDDSTVVDGGVLRANQKFVGPKTYYPNEGEKTNPYAEWDAQTGIFYPNPNPADAAATTQRVGRTIAHSGVINYLNRFSQMNTGKSAKGYDPVSELYYTVVRYFKGLGDIPEYSVLTGSVNEKYQQADAFPVITTWDDPIRYACQSNVVLGIGDTHTNFDKNLPGDTNTEGEPAKPQLVRNDTSVDVVKRMAQIFQMEGRSRADALAAARASTFNFHNKNSAYIAALAYDAHTKDMRPDLEGDQFLTTYWVDVVEAEDYKNPVETNQYWLAAKYGGFQVPAGYDPDKTLKALPEATWWSSREYFTDDKNNRTFKRADNFYIAADAEKMVSSLNKAFSRIVAETKGSGTGLSSNGARLETGAVTYQTQFFSGTWRGDLSAYHVDKVTGALTPFWSANANFPAWDRRVIKFSSAATLKDFTKNNLSQTPLASASAAQIDYLRGNRSQEGSGPGKLRVRSGLMGDIVNSQPLYVGAPNPRLYTAARFSGASAYAAFAAVQANRVPVIYVGANDGMLHAFNANNGTEIFAFVPQAAMPRLLEYTDQNYVHQYYVDGELTAADIYDTTLRTWRSVLVGTLGRGGTGVFALDVTDPSNIGVLWDKTSTDISGLGNILNKPMIVQTSDGTWSVLLGNGPNSTADNAQLIVINLLTGQATQIAVSKASSNGLSGVLPWSSQGNGITDRVYAGDLLGTLWRFSLTDRVWKAEPMFNAEYQGKAQPITATPLGAIERSTGRTWIFFGTGRALSSHDLGNKEVQSWYGLIDQGTTIKGRSTLSQVQILDEGEVNHDAVRVVADPGNVGADGWYMDLISPQSGKQGERMIVSNMFRGGVLIGTTRIPDNSNVCKPSGKGFVMAINPFTGGRLRQWFFDLGNTGGAGSGSTLNGNPVSGVGVDSAPNSPVFTGHIMQVGTDDGTVTSLKTPPSSGGYNMSRVSWREILRSEFTKK